MTSFVYLKTKIVEISNKKLAMHIYSGKKTPAFPATIFAPSWIGIYWLAPLGTSTAIAPIQINTF